MRPPILILQSNPFKESAIATVIVAVITSNLGLAPARGNVRLSRAHSGLSKPSVVNVSQLFTVDKRRTADGPFASGYEPCGRGSSACAWTVRVEILTVRKSKKQRHRSRTRFKPPHPLHTKIST